MRNKGITLVALVITIILLLILAGITIAQLTGSGLFENARLAEEEYKNAQEKEEKILSEYENEIDKYTEGVRNSTNTFTVDVLSDYINSTTLTKVATYDEIKDYKMFILSGYWTGKGVACSTIITLSELLNNSVGDGALDGGSYSYFSDGQAAEVVYNSDEKSVYLRISNSTYYCRLTGIK